MYKINRIALILCLLESFAFAAQGPFTPKSTIIISDLDDVLIKKSRTHKFNLVAGGAYQKPFNTPFYLKALLNVKRRYAVDQDGVKEKLCDAQGNSINGLTFHFLFHGSQNNGELSDYVPWIVYRMEHSRQYIDGTRKIYHYLKYKKGYTIAFATNKDRISYDLTAQAFGEEFANLATHTFVAHPGIHETTVDQLNTFAQQPHAPACYKDFLHKALTIQPTDTIHHVPAPKPDISYYQHVCTTLGTDKQFVFIDDKNSNVQNFKPFGKAIHFEDPAQLANKFVKMGILSETDDKSLLEDIRYPGLWGKLRLYAQKTTAFLRFTKNSILKTDD